MLLKCWRRDKPDLGVWVLETEERGKGRAEAERGVGDLRTMRGNREDHVPVSFCFIFFFFVFLPFLGLLMGHMEVPRLGVKLEL